MPFFTHGSYDLGSYGFIFITFTSTQLVSICQSSKSETGINLLGFSPIMGSSHIVDIRLTLAIVSLRKGGSLVGRGRDLWSGGRASLVGRAHDFWSGFHGFDLGSRRPPLPTGWVGVSTL